MQVVAPLSFAKVDAETTLAAAEFERIRTLIDARTGISLNAGKQTLVYSRLARRLRETRHPSLDAYLQWVEQSAANPEWQELVNCLSTNPTVFFRDAHQFTALAEDLRARAPSPIRIWCSAASTGEEPYSLAMTASETLGRSARVEIVCSDIDTEVLATAARGVYAADARGLLPERLKRHFLRGTADKLGFIRIKPELARMVEFQLFNLMSSSWSALGAAFDLVFCRNVMIRFDTTTQRRVLERMHAVLRPGGLLYGGRGETFSEARDLFRLREDAVFERV